MRALVVGATALGLATLPASAASAAPLPTAEGACVVLGQYDEMLAQGNPVLLVDTLLGTAVASAPGTAVGITCELLIRGGVVDSATSRPVAVDSVALAGPVNSVHQNLLAVKEQDPVELCATVTATGAAAERSCADVVRGKTWRPWACAILDPCPDERTERWRGIVHVTIA